MHRRTHFSFLLLLFGAMKCAVTVWAVCVYVCVFWRHSTFYAALLLPSFVLFVSAVVFGEIEDCDAYTVFCCAKSIKWKMIRTSWNHTFVYTLYRSSSGRKVGESGRRENVQIHGHGTSQPLAIAHRLQVSMYLLFARMAYAPLRLHHISSSNGLTHTQTQNREKNKQKTKSNGRESEWQKWRNARKTTLRWMAVLPFFRKSISRKRQSIGSHHTTHPSILPSI